MASEWLGVQMSRRRSSASGSGDCICLLPLIAIRGLGAAVGLDTISGPVAALVPVSFSGSGAALGLVAIFDTFSGLGEAAEAHVPVSLPVPGAALRLVTVSGPGGAPVPATICGLGAALGLIAVSGLLRPLRLFSLVLVRP